MKEFFRKIHTDRFEWNDFILIASVMSIVLVFIGQLTGFIIQTFFTLILFKDPSPMMETAIMYFAIPGGVWIATVIYLLVVKSRRPILRAFTPEAKGNNVKFLLLGLLIGFGLNFACALVAMLNKDIHVSFRTFNPFAFLLLLVSVFIQSSSEEIIDRGYLFQVLKKGYRSKWVAILCNSIVFSLLHGFNPGVTPLALLNIFFSGLMFSLFTYYFDSIWCAFGIHTGWNFTQSILLGLPNSGQVVPYSIFELDTATAKNSFVYNIEFGIEGTIFSTILLAIACAVIYYLGKKRNQEPLDVWTGFDKKKEEPVENEA